MKSNFVTYLTYLLTLTYSDIDHPSDVVENSHLSDAVVDYRRHFPHYADGQIGLEMTSRVVGKTSLLLNGYLRGLH